MKDHQTILIIGFVWPEPNSSAAGSRIMQLALLFLEQQWKVVFASAASESDFMEDVTSHGIIRKAIELNSSEFDALVLELNPSIVLFDRFMTEEQFGWRVATQTPGALRILDTEDLHCLRLARQKMAKRHADFSTSDLLSEEVAKREIASILRCDLSLIISEFEMNLLRGIFKIDESLLHYLPLFADPIHTETLHNLPGFHQRSHFVFIGNFLHEPNKDAVLYLKESIWPLIHRQLPEESLHIYGAYPSQQVLQWHNPKQHFYVHGRAEDAKHVISNARILLAPLRFGAGIKGKLLEAMQYGTPSATTAIGVEAMSGDLEWNGIVSNDPHELADQTVKLYQDEKSWNQCQLNGMEIINKRFLKSLFADDFITKIQDMQRGLEQHRLSNFTGAMLMHHTLKSTEYMSRWIEAKNKL